MRCTVLAASVLLAGSVQAQDVIEEGKRLFTREAVPLCAVCHTLREAGASGQVGPDLDELRPDAARVEKAMRNGIGQMPANTNLKDAQIRLLANYVASVAGK
ncbi:c-type cytochrome [Noviherbaspirillum sp. ST9]|uniref:SorU family sulfite dehydrogenase c-type cytochrome subunit n=1 Tax=Noviherbaspirillum sp. ST9 TaxID=3401606 RepID=UPI003B58B3FF